MPEQFLKSLVLTICISIGLVTNASHFVPKAQQHIEVSLRMVGHQILLNSGDTTSRVLPITSLENQFKIEFDTDFELQPSELVNSIDSIILNTKIANAYLVEVEHCSTKEIVYSYEVGLLENLNLTPCGGRILPKDCYAILITILDQNLTINTLNQGQLNSVTTPQQSTNRSNKLTILLLIISFIIMVWGIIYYLRKKSPPVQDPAIVKIGQFEFNQRNMTLKLEDSQIELTSKEADLLTLLHSAVNDTIARDVILNTVWGDEGDYVGRTLDVFISKLRKKLEADANVKIVNTRGIGYKLLVNPSE